jgi:type IV secretory pathway VirB2 component (pilin)
MLGRAVRILIVMATVITGFQWAVVATVHDWRVVLAVLGVPALLAAAPLVRALTLTPADRRGYGR